MLTIQRWLKIGAVPASVGIVVLLLIFTALPIVAAATVTQTFKPQGDIVKGNIVSLNSEAKTVSRTTSANIDSLYGVVVNTGSVNFKNTDDGVQVAATGVIDTFVSTLNGPIKSGDSISISSVEGIGEKALAKGKVIGIAQGTLDDSSSSAQDFPLSADSAKQSVKVGLIPVKIDVTVFNPNTGSAESSITSRSQLERLADGVAGKSVSTITLVASGLILM